MPLPLPKLEKKPSLGEGLGLRFMRKAASYEPLAKDATLSSGDDDDSCRGGTRFETASDTVSPKFQKRNQSSTAFLVGSTDDDDVFTDGSRSLCKEESPRKSSEVAPYQDARFRVDPQTIYSGSSCMFVANLPQNHSDRDLEEEVTKVFSQFGLVFVKIKRDSRGMPFAFCQFTNDLDAQNAMRLGKGMVILDRPCRTEMARAHSSFVVYKVSGDHIRILEASELLSRLGEVAKAEYLHDGLRVLAQLPQSVVITYKMYDQRRDPPRVFANHPTFCVRVYDPKSLASRGGVSTANPRQGSFLEQYDRDRHSAYVGNLPPDISKEAVKSLATACGEVLDVQLHHKDVPGGGGSKICFGFVEFDRPNAPDELITEMNNTVIDGFRVRVERKQSRPVETPRRPLPAADELLKSTRRRRGGSIESEIPSQGRFIASVQSVYKSGRRTPYASNSYTPGRSRRSRLTILGSNSSPNKDLFKPPVSTPASSPHNSTSSTQPNSAAAAGALTKKSVEFELSGRVASEPSDAPLPKVDATRLDFKPTTPKVSAKPVASSSNKASPDRKKETLPVSPTTIPWIPPYSPFGYPYMGGVMTPQTNPGMMYGGYMQGPWYPHMYDMFGNLMLSSSPVMPAFGGVPVRDETPTRLARGGEPTDDSATEPSSAGKGKGPAH